MIARSRSNSTPKCVPQRSTSSARPDLNNRYNAVFAYSSYAPACRSNSGMNQCPLSSSCGLPLQRYISVVQRLLLIRSRSCSKSVLNAALAKSVSVAPGNPSNRCSALLPNASSAPAYSSSSDSNHSPFPSSRGQRAHTSIRIVCWSAFLTSYSRSQSMQKFSHVKSVSSGLPDRNSCASAHPVSQRIPPYSSMSYRTQGCTMLPPLL